MRLNRNSLIELITDFQGSFQDGIEEDVVRSEVLWLVAHELARYMTVISGSIFIAKVIT